jgi:hypothetical protein
VPSIEQHPLGAAFLIVVRADEPDREGDPVELGGLTCDFVNGELRWTVVLQPGTDQAHGKKVTYSEVRGLLSDRGLEAQLDSLRDRYKALFSALATSASAL